MSISCFMFGDVEGLFQVGGCHCCCYKDGELEAGVCGDSVESHSESLAGPRIEF